MHLCSMNISFNQIAQEDIGKIVHAIIDRIPPSKIIIFEGKLGSGKTTLISQICQHCGVTDRISSPTFGLVNEYLSSNQTAIYHFDFYRINSIDEAFDIGAEEYFYSGNLCLIEWADRVLELLPANYLKVSITYYSGARNYQLEMK